MSNRNGKDLITVTFHGRGGQGAVMASTLLCELAFAEGYKDALDVPRIGAERRGAPVVADSKISKHKEIKDYSSVINADYTMVFDYTLLDMPSIAKGLSGVAIINAADFVNFDCISQVKEIWVVDATGIAIKNNLILAGYPVLNTLMLGAFMKVTGLFSQDTMKKVFQMKLGSKHYEANYIAAIEAYNSVKKVRG
jgi:2-oxoacid:acceptor oxidoreductase gamma subunit (pyruvate/2-ketoisovalerate family)